MAHSFPLAFAAATLLIALPLSAAPPKKVSFGQPQTFQLPTDVTNSYIGAAGDVNEDGKIDFVVVGSDANGDSLARLVTGKGDGFTTSTDPIIAGDPSLVDQNYYGPDLQLADLNGDGHLDLIAHDPGYQDQYCDDESGLNIYLGDGKGKFSYSTSLTGGGIGSGSYAIGDVNGDGLPDIAYFDTGECSPDGGPGGEDLILYLNQGNGSFTPVHVISTPRPDIKSGQSKTRRSAASTLPAETVGERVAIGDFNGDGKPDIAIFPAELIDGYYQDVNAIQILNGNGDGTFKTGMKYLLDSAPLSMLAADLNGDKRTDLIVGLTARNAPEAGARVATLVSKPDGNFRWESAVYSPFDPYPLGLSDFNGDGIPDLFAGNLVFAGQTGGTFASRYTLGFPANTTPLYSAPTLAAVPPSGGKPAVYFTGNATSDTSIPLGYVPNTSH